jgi:SAM-dependent methyltransferase
MSNHGQRLIEAGISTGILGGENSLDVIRQYVKLPMGAKVLDAGCHGGTLATYIADLYNAKVIGLDISPEAVQFAINNSQQVTTSGELSFEVGDFLKYSPAAKFDLVLHRGLEAFVDDKNILASSCARVLKNWGYLVVITHIQKKDVGSKFRDEFNAQLGMKLVYESAPAFISRYQKEGSFKLLKHVEFDIEANQKKENTSAELKKDQDLIDRNDGNCTGNIFIFRKYDPISALAIDADKA